MAHLVGAATVLNASDCFYNQVLTFTLFLTSSSFPRVLKSLFTVFMEQIPIDWIDIDFFFFGF